MAVHKSRAVTIPATDVHRKFSALIRRAFSGGEHFIVEKEGLPVVVILSMAEYQELMQEREQYEQDKQRRLARFRDAARAIGQAVAQSGLSEEELLSQLEDDETQTYEAYYGDKSAQ